MSLKLEVKMNGSVFAKFPAILLMVLFVASLGFCTLSRSESFKLVTDVLDEFGGSASSPNYSLRIGAGGQPSVVGLSKEDSLWARQGYVNTASFVHGDDNYDGRITVADVVYEINYLFKGGPAPLPPEVGDVNCDNRHTVADVVYKINYLFKGGPRPCNL